MASAPQYLPEASLSPAGAPAVLQLPELDPVLLAVADDGDVVVLITVSSVGGAVGVAAILADVALEDAGPENERFNKRGDVIARGKLPKRVEGADNFHARSYGMPLRQQAHDIFLCSKPSLLVTGHLQSQSVIG